MKMIFKGALLCALSLVMTPPCFAASAADKSKISTLIHSMQSDEDSSVREKAAKSLGEVAQRGDKVVIDALIKQMKKEEDDDARGDMAAALGKVAIRGDKSVVAALIEVLLDETLMFKVCEAADALGKVSEVGNREAINALISCVDGNWPDPYYEAFRLSAAESLAKIALKGDADVIRSLFGALCQPEGYDDNYEYIGRSLEVVVGRPPCENFWREVYDIPLCHGNLNSNRMIALRNFLKMSRSEVVELASLENIRKAAACQGLAEVRKKHQLSHLALGLGIKSGKKRAGGAGAGAGAGAH